MLQKRIRSREGETMRPKEQMLHKSMEHTEGAKFERTILKPETVGEQEDFMCKECSESFLTKEKFIQHLEEHIQKQRKELERLRHGKD